MDTPKINTIRLQKEFGELNDQTILCSKNNSGYVALFLGNENHGSGFCKKAKSVTVRFFDENLNPVKDQG